MRGDCCPQIIDRAIIKPRHDTLHCDRRIKKTLPQTPLIPEEKQVAVLCWKCGNIDPEAKSRVKYQCPACGSKVHEWLTQQQIDAIKAYNA